MIVADAILTEGMRLDADEFMRRWEALPDLHDVELLEGVVRMASPTSHDAHARLEHLVSGWLFVYEQIMNGIVATGTSTVRLNDANVPEPDRAMFRMHSGRSQIDARGYITGSPELVVEIAVSSRERDHGIKRRLYERAGIQEYLIVEPERVTWLALGENGYVELAPDADGSITSQEFPRLRLDVAALLRQDSRGVCAGLRIRFEGMS